MGDVFDSLPQGMARSKKGRIKPVANPALVNLKKSSKQLSEENVDLKQRLLDLEEVVNSLLSKKGKKATAE